MTAGVSDTRWPACTKCGTVLDESALNSDSQCPVCRSQLRVAAFPALTRENTPGASPQLVVAGGEAACFYHPDKRAVVPCDSCGRFLCALCDIELDTKHYCPGCLETTGPSKAVAPLESRRIRYDHVVWSLLILPIPFCMISAPVTATVALILVIWKWRAPPSLLVNTRIRLALGGAVAVAELVGMGLFWILVSRG